MCNFSQLYGGEAAQLRASYTKQTSFISKNAPPRKFSPRCANAATANDPLFPKHKKNYHRLTQIASLT
jgi:hypothetical protein